MRKLVPWLACVAFLVAGAAPAQADIKRVIVSDSGYTPIHAIIAQGDRVKWAFDPANTEEHSATSFLFDSGPLEPGGSYYHKLIGAGVYKITDSTTGDKSFVKVPLSIDPLSGAPSTVFTLTLASEASSRLVYRIQFKYPGAARWIRLQSNIPGPTTTFRPPTTTAGTYEFRVVTALASDRRYSHSLPSPAVSIDVS